MITNGIPNYAAIARAKATTAPVSASRPTGIVEGNNAGRYAGSEAVASSGTPTAASGSVSAARPATMTAAAPAAATTPVVAPYLTPAQIAAYTSAVNKDQSVINSAPASRATLTNTFDQNSAKNAATAQTNFNNTNQSDAARGFGFSGVHDNAMADIQANAVLNQNNYNTAYKTGLATLATNVTNAQNDIGTLGLEYSGTAGGNAQTLASSEGGTVSGSYNLPTVTAPAVAAPVVTPPPTMYFNNPNMGAINSAISSGASAGSAAGVPS